MSVDLSALATAMTNLRTALSSAVLDPTATSANMASQASNLATKAAAIQTILTAGGLDSDLVAQQAALATAIVDGSNALNVAMKATAAATAGSTWPPFAGDNVSAWRHA